MIATGGLLRFNARGRDSLRFKGVHTKTQRTKTKKKRRSEVVVVKGKLKFCSLSALVAVLGVLVLLVGVVMAVLGYWPRDGLFFTTQPQRGTTLPSRPQRKEPEHFNGTGVSNGTTHQLCRGILDEFLDRFLYSDRLKVFGPLIMGIGIFLFICANAVLHENRDKKTKVINVRDIYSTVIDLHSLRKTTASRLSANPVNGLLNYVQSKSLETKPRAPYPASLLKWNKAGHDVGGQKGDKRRPEGDTVFSIYQDQLPCPTPRLWPPPSFSPVQQPEPLCSFTFPIHGLQPSTPDRGHSHVGGHKLEDKEKDTESPLASFTHLYKMCHLVSSCSTLNIHKRAPQDLLLLFSSHSLSSLSHLLSSSLSTPPTQLLHWRRRSFPVTDGATGRWRSFPVTDGAAGSRRSFPVTDGAAGRRQSFPVTYGAAERRQSFPVTD